MCCVDLWTHIEVFLATVLFPLWSVFFSMPSHLPPQAHIFCIIWWFATDSKLEFSTVFLSNMGADQQCCYNSFGNLMLGKPNAGSLNRIHPNAGVPVISNFFHDKVPYQDCCKLTNNCEKYFDRRPSDDGSSYQAPRPGRLIWGTELA